MNTSPNRHRALAGSGTPRAGDPRVLCVVPADDAGRSALITAAEVAGPDGTVVLFDRRTESWRPDDDAVLVAADDEQFDDDELIAAARSLVDGSSADLAIWRSVTPALATGLLDVIQHADISDIVLPPSGREGALGDHVLEGETFTETVEALLEEPLFADADASPTLHIVGAA